MTKVMESMTDHGELALYRAIVASMPEGVAVIRESDGIVTWANGQLASILGRDPGDVRGRPSTDLLDGGEVEQSTARSSTRTVSIAQDDGTTVLCRSTISKFEHPDYGPAWLAIVSPINADASSPGEISAGGHESVMRGATLPARGTLQDDMTRELSRALRSDAPLSIALVSLDGELDFADPGTIDLLASATQAWREALRDSDSIAYYDFGEFEYVLLLPDCHWEEAETVTERARSATPGPRTCSAGFATWNRSEEGLQLVTRAHLALRKARRAGGDRSVGAASSNR